MCIVNTLWFIDVVIFFPVLLGLILIDSFKILFLKKKIKIEFVNFLYFFACLHTLATIIALIKM